MEDKITDDFVIVEYNGKKYKISNAEVYLKDINTGEVKFRFPLPTSTFASFPDTYDNSFAD